MLSPDQQIDLLGGGKRGMSVFKVRNISNIASSLGAKAIHDVFTGMPMHVTMNPIVPDEVEERWSNDLNTNICSFALTVM